MFLREPSPIMFPVDSEEKKVKLSCEVKGNPKPHIRCVDWEAVVLSMWVWDKCPKTFRRAWW